MMAVIVYGVTVNGCGGDKDDDGTGKADDLG